MTYEQAKDQIAKEEGYSSFELMIYDDKINRSSLVELSRRAAELYADSVARDASINFADYLKDNRWRLSIETGNWERTFSHCAPEIKTTAELYTIFLEYRNYETQYLN